MTPNIIKTPYTPEEDKRLMQLQAQLGNKWCMIAKEMPGRTGGWQLAFDILSHWALLFAPLSLQQL
jgi:Myb-like DNA-binding domain